MSTGEISISQKNKVLEMGTATLRPGWVEIGMGGVSRAVLGLSTRQFQSSFVVAGCRSKLHMQNKYVVVVGNIKEHNVSEAFCFHVLFILDSKQFCCLCYTSYHATSMLNDLSEPDLADA